MAVKGNRVRFIAGKYGGKTGWIDTERPTSENTLPVIVDLGHRGEKETYVFMSSVRVDEEKAPTSYADAVIQQCPDLEKLLVATCRAFAKCDIARDTEGFERIVAEKMNEAMTWQTNKGSKALYRKIKYNG